MNSNIKYKKLLDRVVLTVKRSALILKKPIRQISHNQNPSTNIDYEISNFLSKTLKKILNIEVLSEESLNKPPIFHKQCWIIDPIDGTMNYISGSPDVAISVALVDAKFNVTLSVLFLPYFNELYTAIRGDGAKLNGKKLTTTAKSLNTVSFGIPSDANSKNISSDIKKLISNGFILRQSGSAVVDICKVAKGVWRSFFEKKARIWDIIAADLIAREAGNISDLILINNNYECDYVLSNSHTIHRQLKTLLEWRN